MNTAIRKSFGRLGYSRTWVKKEKRKGTVGAGRPGQRDLLPTRTLVEGEEGRRKDYTVNPPKLQKNVVGRTNQNSPTEFPEIQRIPGRIIPAGWRKRRVDAGERREAGGGEKGARR
ncbi:hypothetical protein KM043_011444 [Ampulex compressa]|nr:hypothetical protein KM043_011444 [Ampulex compressa]